MEIISRRRSGGLKRKKYDRKRRYLRGKTNRILRRITGFVFVNVKRKMKIPLARDG